MPPAIILCPNLKQEETRDKFNKLLTRLGGKPMDESHINDRDAYKESLAPEELSAYFKAFYHFSEHQGDFGKMNEYLDAWDKAYSLLNKSAPG